MSRYPDFRVGCMNKTTNEKSPSVGAAWINENGSISVVLDCFITIPQQDGKRSVLLTLFPTEEVK